MLNLEFVQIPSAHIHGHKFYYIKYLETRNATKWEVTEELGIKLKLVMEDISWVVLTISRMDC